MANTLETTLGGRIREARLARTRGLRDFARELDITPSYLSDIENDRRVPAEPVLRTLATKLDLDFNELMSLGGRLGEEAERYVRRVPEAARLFRRMAEQQLEGQDLQKLDQEIDKLTGET
jgi:transcriptional regulator with XRE-family HTH domain